MKALFTSVLVLVLSIQYVQAYDGQINFYGSIVDVPSSEQQQDFEIKLNDVKTAIENDVKNKLKGRDDMIPALKKWSKNKKNYRNYTWIEKIEVQELNSNAATISVSYI